MILGYEIMSKLNIDLCFSNYNIMGNWGDPKECTESMKEFSKASFNFSSNCLR